MCEAKPNCQAKSRYWAQRDSANLLVCGRHLPATIDRLRSMDPTTAHESYHLVDRSPIIIKTRSFNSKGWELWT